MTSIDPIPVDDPALRALQDVLDAMPPVHAMRIRTLEWDGERLRLHAPLADNVNDKACAFGGSMASIMTLAAWGHCWLRAQEAEWKADIFVADSEIAYRRPLYDDLLAEAWLDEDDDWPTLLRAGRERGRCRATLHARVLNAEGGMVCRMRARYALIGLDKD